jgi:hypothetical protein
MVDWVLVIVCMLPLMYQQINKFSILCNLFKKFDQIFKKVMKYSMIAIITFIILILMLMIILSII